ncbi:hypothetical protein KY345_03295 [Candidatus Woesearchaeota archaeon]|nr:hypothetical protein [Candidatus Woesearchaeota archaeon]
MENLKFLKSKQIKQILKLIEEQWGFSSELDYTFLINTKGDIFIVNRDIEKIEFEKLRINNLGLYFAEYRNNELRLGIEGSQIIGKNAKKGILEIDDDQLKRYMKGEELEIEKEDTGFLLIKNNDDFFGCSKIKNNKLLNFFPKSRRI